MTATDFIDLVQVWPFIVNSIHEDDLLAVPHDYMLAKTSGTAFSEKLLVVCAARLADYVSFNRRNKLMMADLDRMDQKIKDHHNMFRMVHLSKLSELLSFVYTQCM